MWGPLIAAGISAGGSLLGGMMGAAGQSATNAQMMAFNAQEAQNNRNWQTEMSNTAYQRQMADMRAAGLNPILAAGGPGASSGSGAQGSASLGNPGAFTGAGVSSAGGAAGRAIELQAVREQTKKAESETTLNEQMDKNKKAEEALTHELNTKARQDTATSAAQQHGILTTAANTQADTVNKGIQAAILGHDAVTAFQKSRIAKREADDREQSGQGTYGDLYATSKRVTRDVGSGMENLGRGAWNVYSENIGKPFAQGVGSIIDKFRSADPGPGLVIDMKRK